MLHTTCYQYLRKKRYKSQCDVFLQQLSRWFLSIEEHVRERSLNTLLIVEQFLLENIEPSSGVRRYTIILQYLYTHTI